MTQTTEIQIQNQAGLPFRQKMNLMLSALNTCFAGTAEPTVTEAYMNWLDTSVTPNVLKRRNAGDTAFETHPLQSLADAAKLTADAAMPTAGGNFTGAANANKGADIASAATTDLGAATGEYVRITGTTAITALGTAQAGTQREVTFSASLVLTHNATSLILPSSSNITTSAGDCATFRSEGGGNWRCVKYQRADGSSVAADLTNQRMSLVAPIVVSGASVDFTGIPSWAKKITVIYSGISTTGSTATQFTIQLGTSGGVVTSGYAAGTTIVSANTASSTIHTSGAVVANGVGGTGALTTGVTTVVNLVSSTWNISGGNNRTDSASGGFHNASISLGGVLNRVRLQAIGSDTFDAGSVSLLIEGY